MDDTKSRLMSGALFGFFQTLLMAFAMLIPAMYFSSLNISIVVYAFLLSIGDVFSFIAKPLVGHWTDKHGERRYLMAGGFIFFFSLFLIGQTTSIEAITALKIIGGVASALVYVIILIYSYRKVKEKPERKIGTFNAITNVGWMVGLLIPGIFIDAFGINPAFYLIFAVGVIWLLLMFRFAKKSDVNVSAKPSFSFVKKIPSLIIMKTMDVAMFSAFIFFFTRYALQTLGLSRSVVSFIVVAEVVFFALSSYVVGRISNKKLRRYWIPLCVAFHALAATAMVFAGSLVHYYLVGIFIGVAGGLTDIWIYSKINETYEAKEKGKVIATFGWSFDLATIAGAQIPLIFIAFGLGTFTSLYVFPIMILFAYMFARKS